MFLTELANNRQLFQSLLKQPFVYDPYENGNWANTLKSVSLNNCFSQSKTLFLCSLSSSLSLTTLIGQIRQNSFALSAHLKVSPLSCFAETDSFVRLSRTLGPKSAIIIKQVVKIIYWHWKLWCCKWPFAVKCQYIEIL